MKKHKLIPATDIQQAFFTSYEKDGKYISFYGDNHPYYAGSVVKAMASAKYGYPKVAALFKDEIQNVEQEIADGVRELPQERAAELDDFFKKLEHNFRAHVVKVEYLTETILEVIVHAPYAAKHFEPGEFYRLQNYEVDSPVVNGTKLQMEGLAMTGAWTDPERGLLSMIVLEMGTSSRLVSFLKEGQRVVVMGPTGAPTHIPQNETVLLAGGGLGNAVLFSISKALKANGNKVIYFAGYKNGADVFKMEDIESSTDKVIWSSDIGPEITPNRPQDAHYRGNIIQAMHAYLAGELGEQTVDFKKVNRIIAIGSDGMMRAVKEARHTSLKPHLNHHVAIGSINSPMQCMMKEICAQCLQKHVDPVTGVEVQPVFSCFNQDQELDRVDFKNLRDRLKMNSVLEKLGNSWLTYLIGYEEKVNA
ncbi:MAG TPA: hypothetical protein VEC36_01715 [Patescibacteria group bacterium]|nr:hypothetical protein [Patescibacteria group bacterium]